MTRPIAAHRSLIKRNLPKEYYGAFDVRPTQDGGKEYLLPHTLDYTAMILMTHSISLVALSVAALWAFLLTHHYWLPNHIRAFLLTPERLSLGAAMYFPVVVILTVMAVMFVSWLVDFRITKSITIRDDGLIIDNDKFYPAQHVLEVIYNDTKDGKARYIFDIELGVHHVELATDLEEPAALIFQAMFSNDLRRYWYRHN